ncbi:hypothetical protein NBE99_06210 [Thermosynechococcus sp. HN-54]|uniref:hypothetical protein n=1 Tax=Thermosynechococcus sp. HN-54 TaxID=2933959 RepID=UPI00202CDC77|nr:hypothetical protein [Thermosynechococcus sp. HN-54]URR36722.1 hypothetical protein NBE99_06210 [Thermosynechococcus sp. HN-54]
MVKALSFPIMAERQHPLIQPLLTWSDEALIKAFQDERDRGCYFVALYCRYAALVYSVLQHHGRSPVQVDYLFAKVWHGLFFSFDLVEFTPEGVKVGDEEARSLRNWIVNRTATLIQEELPGVEHISYVLQDAPPPLWCYLEASLAYLNPLSRLVLVTTQTFHWGLERVRAYLEVQGETYSLEELNQHLEEGLARIVEYLPPDIRQIYLMSDLMSEETPAAQPTLKELFPNSVEEVGTHLDNAPMASVISSDVSSTTDASIDNLLAEWERILSG